MERRIHTDRLHAGEIELPAAEAHHVRDVLRLVPGSVVEIFDDEGSVGRGVLTVCGSAGVVVRVNEIQDAPNVPRWVVASAVPKGERADWLVEKISELGASAFTPLITARSVVLPEGRGKRDRWLRLATESAKQSRRSGVMKIHELTPLGKAIESALEAWPVNLPPRAREQRRPIHPPAVGWYLSTEENARPIHEVVFDPMTFSSLTLFVGPEGGWTPTETKAFDEAGFTPVALTDTVLRIETACVAAATIASAMLMPRLMRATNNVG
ncbi:MAG: RsmE family RNA methyltransferase [Tepidisphaeraceae bacterium]